MRREQLGHDFFLSGEENVTAQRVQHEILIEFANRGRGKAMPKKSCHHGVRRLRDIVR